MADPLDVERGGGIERYTYKLIEHLLKIDREDLFFLFHQKNHHLFADYPNVRHISLSDTGLVSKNLEYRRLAKEFCLDIIHGTYHGIPLLAECPKVVTFHDIMYKALPLKYFNKKDAIHDRFAMPAMLRFADHIIADSISTKKDLMKHYYLNEHDITVVYLGPTLYNVSMEDIRVVRRKIGLAPSDEYILFVSNMKPVKNVKGLIKAFFIIRNTIPHRLVIVGRPAPNSEPYRLAEFLGVDKRILFTGYLTDREVAALYKGASVLALPSIFEGFGLPVLEAMAYGVPCVWGRATSLPEVAGDVGIGVDPFNPSDIARGLIRSIKDSKFRQDTIRKGLERAKIFSWEKCAGETLKVYREVVSRN
ncbi:MAG: glycosyltransferase family 1 protein [Thermoplasmata archaeon]